LAQELGARHQISLVSFSRQYPALLFPGRTQLDPARNEPTVRAEPLIDSVNPVTWFRTADRIIGLCPDLVIVHWWNPIFGLCVGATLRLARRRSRATVAFICHNVLPHESFPGTRALTRFATGAADAFLLHSETDRRILISLQPGAKALVFPLPPARGFGDRVTKEDARSRLGVSGNVVLFFGLIRPYKGLPYLIQALPLVLQRLDCTLLVAGEFYEGKHQCMELARSLDLGSRIRFVDRFIPDEEVSLYFSAADLVVLPYLSATQSGVVPIAYAFERPVVTTRVGGLPEAVRDGETGYVVEPGDSRALAEAILRFYREASRMPFHENIRRAESTRSWARVVAAIESLAG
jgi:glycosyltransferase involved in cell wall biosynthesis